MKLKDRVPKRNKKIGIFSVDDTKILLMSSEYYARKYQIKNKIKHRLVPINLGLGEVGWVKTLGITSTTWLPPVRNYNLKVNLESFYH